MTKQLFNQLDSLRSNVEHPYTHNMSADESLTMTVDIEYQE
jgi:hypothetical protein